MELSTHTNVHEVGPVLFQRALNNQSLKMTESTHHSIDRLSINIHPFMNIKVKLKLLSV